ncbi:MAG: 5-methyltetrahydropteroyltriglutamate--homocysteine methyltransferase [Hyphomicrobiaceae bacterium]
MTDRLLPTTLVGSYPQPGWLVDKAALMRAGPPRVRMREVWRFEGALLDEAQRDAARLAVADQERAGIDIVTDGEVGRESYFNLFATSLDGIDLDNPGIAINRRGKKTAVPRVTGPIVWRESALAPAAAHLRSLTSRPIKVTVPGPFTLTTLAEDQHYRDPVALAQAYAVAVNQELKALKAVGVDIVQLDEPYLQAEPDKARAYAVPAITAALEGVSGTKALHLCFGYAYVVKEKPSGYSFLAELADVPVDQISIEAAQPRLDPATLPMLAGKSYIYGVLDLGDESVEPAAVVAARIRAALRHIPAERLILAPDCGMKYLPRDVAYGKLDAMCRAAETVRRELAG